VDEDLARTCRNELLERRVDRLGVAVTALESGRAKETADDLRLGLTANDCHDGRVVQFGHG
jgi:hypothetical protein